MKQAIKLIEKGDDLVEMRRNSAIKALPYSPNESFQVCSHPNMKLPVRRLRVTYKKGDPDRYR